MLVSKCVIFILHTSCFVGLNLIVSEGLIWLELSNDGPAILDSTIDFFAALKGDGLKDSYIYRFQDMQQESKDVPCGINCTYSIPLSPPLYVQGNFTMKVTVFEVDSSSAREVASNRTSFMVTESINGDIEIFKEGNVELGNFIPSGKQVNLTSYIHDPNGFFQNATMNYFWQINEEPQGYAPDIQHTFTKTGQSHVLLAVAAEFPKSEPKGKVGLFQKQLTVQDEIPRIKVSGETLISHGKMLNLNAACNGSAPFHYCWEIYPGDVPKANFTCDYPLSSNFCNFTVNQYLSATGQYYLSILVENQVSTKTRSLDIRILDTSHIPQLSVTVIPITCAILAIIIVVAGIAYYLHQRKQYVIEVANFDFIRSEELMEMNFFERLCNAINNSFLNIRSSGRNSGSYRRLGNNYGSLIREDSSNHPTSLGDNYGSLIRKDSSNHPTSHVC